jgi:hypothetical protein
MDELTNTYCPEQCETWERLASSGIDLGGLAYCPGCGTPLQVVTTAVGDGTGEALPEIPDTVDGILTAGMEDLKMPDRMGEVIGWRAWNVVALGKLLRLRSKVHAAHWPTDDWVYSECSVGGWQRGANHEARKCDASDDGKTPGEHCSCGLYAAASPEQLDDLAYASTYRNEGQITVVGQVAMAGKVIEGSQGWRGEKARVFKLYIPFDREIGRALAMQYRVPVELRPVTDLSDFYGQTT